MLKLTYDGGEAYIEERGAYVANLYLAGKKILKEKQDKKLTHGGSATMIPFANRVRNHTYVFEGEQYFLPKNDGENSIHGLIMDSPFDIITQEENYIVMNYKLSHPGFPSELDINISFKIKRSEFITKFSIKNIGSKRAPIMVGAHPYFNIKGDYHINYEEPAFKLNYIDKYFPDGRAEFVDLNGINLSGSVLDNTFYGGGKIRLRSEYSEVEIGRKNMPFFVLYNGKYAEGKSIAIEPLTGAPDAFNNGIGLKIIDPLKSLNTQFKIKLIR